MGGDAVTREGGQTPRSAFTRVDGSALTAADERFFALRESGWDGWIDQDGYPVEDLDEWIDQSRSCVWGDR